MKAINEVIENKENFISIFRSNVLEVIANYNHETDKILNNINPNILTFDQEIIKRLIESIKFKRNNVIDIRFYCGIVVDKVVE